MKILSRIMAVLVGCGMLLAVAALIEAQNQCGLFNYPTSFGEAFLLFASLFIDLIFLAISAYPVIGLWVLTNIKNGE